MRRNRFIIALAAINLLLAAAILVKPIRAQILPKAGLLNCCQGHECCDHCCWLTWNCNDDGDCGVA